MSIEDTIHLVIVSLRDNGAPADLVAATVADLRKAAKQEKDSKPSAVKTKTRLVAFLRSADPIVQRAAEAGIFIASVPDDDSTATYSGPSLLARLRTAVIAHNEAPKGRRKAKTKVTTWQECFAHVKAKTLKESGSVIGIKQRGQPCELVVLVDETVEAKP